MNLIKTHIIPKKVQLIGEPKTLDYKAICVFTALGFFLEDDTYYVEQKALQPATEYQLENNRVVSQKPYFKWYYQPVERSLQQITKEFATLFEQILTEQAAGQRVILPLSGGLDSRTQACGLQHLGAEVHSYSYQFEGGHAETAYAKKIAQVCRFPFESWSVPPGYLWDCIDELATLNGCYSEFTHPRQMAFIDRYASLGQVFSLGHWGDVLFDDMGVPDDLSVENQVAVLLKKIVKNSGMELATALWSAWGLEGNFKDYLYQRLKSLLININIPESANAQIRAFKSLFWAHRWTSVNLSVFESQRPIALPYYDNRMCEFICTIPEKYLAGRQIQIEYLKMRNPALARISWQSHKPFNLYNYHWNKTPYNLPYRVYDKIRRSIRSGTTIQRNWELQFVGEHNDRQLQHYLFENPALQNYIPEKIICHFYEQFTRQNAVYYSHPISMLLTLSLFFKNYNK